eukprot:m.268446 g.268446  ORF g.268446 m.268446 type:complete len:162 (+) comp40528_c0_seq3:488-973(+)
MRCSDTLGAFINNWERKLYPNEFQDFMSVPIRRAEISADAFRWLQRRRFDPLRRIKVAFVGEKGTDTGGPTREMWRVLAEDFKRKFFWGQEEKMVPIHSAENVASLTFHNIAKLMAISTIHQGSGFPYLFLLGFSSTCSTETRPRSMSASMTFPIPAYATF